jgi:murein DD-endopeptidase MepM/ murein hydrolase activator NlpD
MHICYLLIFIVLPCLSIQLSYQLPVRTIDRYSISSLSLTEIGDFGVLRKERAGIPAHFHTGIDIKRPTDNYQDEPVFPIAEGIVISIRRDGPYAQIIIEHEEGQKLWTVYEHIAGITVNLYDKVNPEIPIARFMNKNELDEFGWQFNHFHFEILKIHPNELAQRDSNPERLLSSYTLVCYTVEELTRKFYDPIEFFMQHLRH